MATINDKTIFVEREQITKNDKTFFTYYIKGNVRGTDVRIAIVPPDFGGYTVLDIVYNGELKAELVLKPYEIRDEKTGKVVKGNSYGVISTDEKPNKLDVYFELVKTVVPLPADPVKEGCTFVGWYYDSAFTRPYDGSHIYEDTQLYAKFAINRYTVTFDSNGGSAVNNMTVDWNTAVTLPTTTRDKHAFKGWFLPNGTKYTNQPIKENTTLTAQWERNVFNVTFDTDGGSAVNNTEVNLNAVVTLPTTTRTGYTLKGWFLPNGTQYTNQPVTTDISLTAQWEVIICTVTFYVDGEKYDE